MRILVVTHNLNCGDGQGRVNLEIARHALSRGHEVTLIAGRVDDQLLVAGAKWIQAPERIKRPSLLRCLHFTQMANSRVRGLEDPVDIILGNGYVLTEPHDISISHFVHHAWRSHQRLVSGQYGLGGWYRSLSTQCNVRLERKSYNAARMVVAVSQRICGELIEAGVPAKKIRVVHNGVDLDDFRPGVEDRTALGLPVGVPLGLFVGDVRTYRKNLDTVLNALVRVPSLHLAVVGAFERSPFPAMSSALGIADRVHFLGFRRDVARIMRGCTFLAFPTRYEPFGLVVLEAMSSGLPVVTTRIAGAAEVMSEDSGVLLDDPENVEVLAAAMKKMSDNSVGRRAGAAARKLAESHSWAQMAGRYLALFEELKETRS